MSEIGGQHHPAAVVATANGLDHQRSIDPGRESVDVIDCLDGGETWHRQAEFAQPSAHRELVLSEHQRLGGGQHGDALGDEDVQQMRRYVLMVESQCVGADCGPPQRIQIGMGSDHHVGADLSSRVIRIRRQHPQALAEGDRGLMGHPGQLTATHHRNLRHA